MLDFYDDHVEETYVEPDYNLKENINM